MISTFPIDRALASQEFGTATQRLVPWTGQGDEPPFGKMACFLEPGAETAPDCHNQDELVILLTGEIDLEVDGEHRRLTTGEMAHLPRNARHVLTNPTDERVSWISVYWPLREPAAEGADCA